MAIIVETGASMASSNSYLSLASANSYFYELGITTWTGPDTSLEGTLIRAARYMETLPWRGLKTLSTQALEWPRRDVVDHNNYYISSTAIPLRIKQAQAELALRYLSGGNPAPDLSQTGGVVRERVDVIEIEYDRSGKRDVPEYMYIDFLLKPYLKSSLNVELVRA